MKLDLNHFKDLLIKEKDILEAELKTVVQDDDRDRADETEVADDIEELLSNTAVGGQLEIRLKEVKEALAKIDDEKYGICEVCGESIEEDRLTANPAAKTCKLHMNP